MNPIYRWLENPLTRGCDLDDPATTALRRKIIRGKPFLRRLYLDWYQLVLEAVPAGPGRVVELGSGAGFLQELKPEVITSDVMWCPGVRLISDAERLPFQADSLRAVVMVDVLHHLPRCRRFFAEAARCVRAGGAVVAVEPWVTPWSRWVYQNLHHEPFRPDAAQWEFPSVGPLSAANSALPWILFQRDRRGFEQNFPQWHVKEVRLLMPFRYLLSGGVSLRSLAPGWVYPLVSGVERLLAPVGSSLAMFARIVLHRSNVPVLRT